MKALFLTLLFTWGVSGASEIILGDYQKQLVGNPFIDVEGRFLYNESLLNFAAMGGGSTVGNGGDAIYCEGEQGSAEFWGYYALDYLLTYVKSNNNKDIVAVRSWEQSRNRILGQLRNKAPLLARQFEHFVAGMDNFVDYSAPIIWQEAPFGLVDLKDENMMRLLPENCYQENKPLIFQLIRRVQHSSNYVVFEFNLDLYQLFRFARPLQFSMMMLHEFAWSYTNDVSKVRQFVRMIHSRQLEGYSVDAFAKVLENLNINPSEVGPSAILSPYHELMLDEARRGNFELVEKWIEAGADINLPAEKDHWTVLMYAAKYGNVEAVQRLLDKGALVNVRNDSGNSALIVAVANNHLEAARILLGTGAQVDLKGSCGKTALMKAVEVKNEEMVGLLISAQADLNIKADNGDTALIKAAEVGNGQAVRLLVAAKADPNIKGYWGETALMLAVNAGNKQMVDLLIAAEADLNMKSNRGDTALRVAIKKGNFELAKYLIEVGADASSGLNLALLIEYIADGRIRFSSGLQILNLLLSSGVEVSSEQKIAGRSMLRYLLDNADKEEEALIIAEILFDAGIEIDSALISFRDDHPLAEAIDKKRYQVTQFLLKHEISVSSDDLESVIYNAIRGNNLEKMELLFATGVLDEEINTFLVKSITYESIDVIKLLLNKGADLNYEVTGVNDCQSGYGTIDDRFIGYTPLMLAAVKRKERLIDVFMKFGTNINHQNSTGMTALMAAAKHGTISSLKVLLELGADKKLKDHRGKNAYDYAKEYGDDSLGKKMKKLLFWW